MRTESSILKSLGSLMTQITPEWLSRNPLGTILNLLIIYTVSGGADIYEKQVHRIDHYLGKDIVNNILTPALLIFYWNLFGTGRKRRFRSLQQRPSVVRVVLNIMKPQVSSETC